MSAPLAKPLRISSIRLCGYRAFPHIIEIPLANPGGPGRSLVLYGENGSGKSSIGKAVRDLLSLGAQAADFDVHRYRYGDAHDAREVTLFFDDPTKAPLSWKPAGRDTTHADFTDMARARGWMDYRLVWKATEVPVWADCVQVFDILAETLVSGCESPLLKGTFGTVWTSIREAAAQNPTHGKGTAVYQKLQRMLTEITTFNQALEAFLPEVVTQANRFLPDFAPWTKLSLKWVKGASYRTNARSNKFSQGSIELRMHYRDELPLKAPTELLNEARVTAIGLCLYLAGLSKSIPARRSDGSSYPRVLVLDDVLLSLDMTHRVPLLRILREHFKNWQVLLLTHDRAWYEIAKQHLAGWAHCELFSIRVGDYEQPIRHDDHDHLFQALLFLEAGHIKAAAVHMRTRFEEVLKQGCVRLGVKVPFASNPRTVTARDLWSSLLAHEVANLSSGKTFTKDGVTYAIRPRPIRDRIIDTALQERIDHALSWVLNPLSHSESVASYRQEIEDAVYAVADLEASIHDVCIRQEVLFQHERAEFLRLLSKKPASETHATAPAAAPKPA